MGQVMYHAGDFWGAVCGRADRRSGMPDPLSVAMSLREYGESFPGLEQYGFRLGVGLSVSLTFGRLRAALTRLGSENPDINVRWIEAESPALIADVAGSRLDLAFVHGDPAPTGCRSELLWAERLLVALPEAHPLARENALARSDLRRERFLVAEADESGAGAALVQRALEGRPASLVSAPVQRETLMSLVALGQGLAITPACALGAFYPGVAYRPFEGRQPFLPVHCAWRTDNEKPELKAFVDPIIEVARREAGR